jgi:hypothetical protein
MPLTAAKTAVFESFEAVIGPAFEFSGEVTNGTYAPLPFTGTASVRYVGAAGAGRNACGSRRAN